MSEQAETLDTFVEAVLAGVHAIGDRYDYAIETAQVARVAQEEWLVLLVRPLNVEDEQRYAIAESLSEAHRRVRSSMLFLHGLRGELRDFFGGHHAKWSAAYAGPGDAVWLTPPPGEEARTVRPGRRTYAEVVADARRRMAVDPELIETVERTIASATCKPRSADGSYEIRDAYVTGTFPDTQLVLTVTAPRFGAQRFGWAIWLWNPSWHATTGTNSILGDADISLMEHFDKVDSEQLAAYERDGDLLWVVKPNGWRPW